LGFARSCCATPLWQEAVGHHDCGSEWWWKDNLPR
jgi:hypothetical protein